MGSETAGAVMATLSRRNTTIPTKDALGIGDQSTMLQTPEVAGDEHVGKDGRTLATSVTCCILRTLQGGACTQIH